jgi:hypothetical protein
MEYSPFCMDIEYGVWNVPWIILFHKVMDRITVPWNEFIINIINNQQGFIQRLQVNTSRSPIKKLRLEIR